VGTQGAVVLEIKAAAEAVSKALSQVNGVKNVQVQTQSEGWTHAVVTANAGEDLREPLGKAVASNQWTLREMRHEAATLEQFFIQITAQQTRGT